MSSPISPAPVRRWRPTFLPAYVGNGLLGLRVTRIPLLDGVAIVSGFAGVHPIDRVEGFARAPYPLAGDVVLGDAALSDYSEGVTLVEQRYDFSCGELTTRLRFDSGAARAEVDILTFCSRTQPTIAAQEVSVRVDRACDVTLRASVDPTGLAGSFDAREPEPARDVDGAMRWESHGALSKCGAAYATAMLGAPDARRETAGGELQRLSTGYAFRARVGRAYRLRQLTSLVPDSLNSEPDRQAIRLVYSAAEIGFEDLRAMNRRAWDSLWEARIRLVGAPRRWQALADAAFFYLHSSAHSSSPSSTSMFGLSYWPDYHYYRGHVMWDIEAFALPPLLLTDPGAARALLDYRADRLPAARANAQMAGYRGAQYPWESSPRFGIEAAPAEGAASGREHHVALDVAHAFARFVHATGDLEYARTRAWPVVRGVADWIESRVAETKRGYEIRRVTGVAEKERAENNSAFVNLGAITVLGDALALADLVGAQPGRRWEEIARRLIVPLDRRTGIIRNYDGHRATDEKGDTPEAAAALFLFDYETTPRIREATYRRAVELAAGYVGSPMLSALLGVFAARVGERDQALDLFERGYADFVLEPFTVTDEYSPKVFPDQERAGPFAANIGAFLSALLYGLTGIRLGADDPVTWCAQPPSLPAGWRAIEVDRIWIRGAPARLVARHGDRRAQLQPIESGPVGA
jgi:trehalose/maltose hydrolase-like predicted phosphorylase